MILKGMKTTIAGGAVLVLGACSSHGEIADGSLGKVSSAVAGPAAWGMAQSLHVPDAAPIQSLAVSGNTLIVGVTGAAYFYARSSGNAWALQQKLTTTDDYETTEPSIYSPAGEFGGSVALSGDTALVGCSRCAPHGVRGAGSAYVYSRSAETWTLQAVLTASPETAQDRLGTAVALDGDTALATSAKGAHEFVRSGESWLQKATLSLPKMGIAAALSGDTAVVVTNGAPSVRIPHSASYLFERSASVWSDGVVLSQDLDEGDVAIAGGQVFVASWEYFLAPYSRRDGATRVYSLDGVLAGEVSGGREVAASADGVLVTTDYVAQKGSEGVEPSNLSPALLYRDSGAGWQEAYDFSTVPAADHLAMDDGVIAFAHDDRTVTVLTKYSEPEASCSADTDCASGHCVEGLCCDTVCSGDACKSCTAAKKGYGADGICDWIGGDTHTVCAEPSCGTYTPFMLETQSVVQHLECKDRVGCSAVARQVCNPYRCDAQTVACAKSCTRDDDCLYVALGYHCIAGKCTQNQPPDPGTGGGDAGGSSGGSESSPGGQSSAGSESSPGGESASAGTAGGGMSAGGPGGSGGADVPHVVGRVRDVSKHESGCAFPQRPTKGGSSPWLVLVALLAATRRRAGRRANAAASR